MTTVLLASDGSPLSHEALAQGLRVLGNDHRFIALTVVPPAFVPAAPLTPMDTHPTLSDPDLEQQVEHEEEAESTVDLGTLLAELGITAEQQVVVGEPGPTICDLAAQLGAGVIVIGSHGQGWLRRVFLGSVSQYVLQHAPCPVLVTRAVAPSPEPSSEG